MHANRNKFFNTFTWDELERIFSAVHINIHYFWTKFASPSYQNTFQPSCFDQFNICINNAHMYQLCQS